MLLCFYVTCYYVTMLHVTMLLCYMLLCYKHVTMFIFILFYLERDKNVMLCAIWYHVYNFKNVKNTHRGVLLLLKFRLLTCNFTKSNSPP